MAAKNNLPMIGAWLFLLGLVIAVIGGFWSQSWMPWLLGIIGIVVGLVNISEKEVNSFLIAAVAFLLSVTSLAQSVYAARLPSGSHSATLRSNGCSRGRNSCLEGNLCFGQRTIKKSLFSTRGIFFAPQSFPCFFSVSKLVSQ